MQNMSPELLKAIEMSEASRRRMEAHAAGRVDDRRTAQVSIEHEDRRKGPRRMAEKRAMMTGKVESN